MANHSDCPPPKKPKLELPNLRDGEIHVPDNWAKFMKQHGCKAIKQCIYLGDDAAKCPRQFRGRDSSHHATERDKFRRGSSFSKCDPHRGVSQRHLGVRWDVNKGWCLCTTTKIKEGTAIINYVGEEMSPQTFASRRHQNYAFQLRNGIVIDAYMYGNESRYLNDSPQPNCDACQQRFKGKWHIVIVANREISAGEELTIDYHNKDSPWRTQIDGDKESVNDESAHSIREQAFELVGATYGNHSINSVSAIKVGGTGESPTRSIKNEEGDLSSQAPILHHVHTGLGRYRDVCLYVSSSDDATIEPLSLTFGSHAEAWDFVDVWRPFVPVDGC